MSEASVEKGRALPIVARGLRGEAGAWRSALGLSERASDRDVARMAARLAAAEVFATLEGSGEHPRDPRPTRVARSAPTGDSSLLGQLESEASSELASIEEAHTLILTLRAGSFRLRRAAVARLARLLARGKISSDRATQIEAEIGGLRDATLEFELRRALSTIRGTMSRKIFEEEADVFGRVVSDLERAIEAFWQGERATEPLTELSAEHRAMVLLRLRDTPEAVARQVAAVVEGDDGGVPVEARRALLESLRHCADRRIVPSLVAVLESGAPELALPAARVLGRMDDGRATSALRSAFHRTVPEAHRAVMAGALGIAGDSRGAELVRGIFRASADKKARLAALEALESLGSADDALRVADSFSSFEGPDLAQAVHVTGRIGDSRVLPALAALEARIPEQALRAEIGEARAAVLARLELRGELPSEHTVVDAPVAGAEMAEVMADKPPIVRQFVGFRHYLVGLVFMALKLRDRAIRRFKAAGEALGWWAIPHISIGAIYAKRGEYGQALVAYRRALEREPARVQANAITMRLLSRCFLRRAEQLIKEGRRDIAAGLVAEANKLDLRKAPGVIRFELMRLERALRRGDH